MHTHTVSRTPHRNTQSHPKPLNTHTHHTFKATQSLFAIKILDQGAVEPTTEAAVLALGANGCSAVLRYSCSVRPSTWHAPASEPEISGAQYTLVGAM